MLRLYSCFVFWMLQSSGSPPSAFRVPYDSFRESIDSRVTECSLDDGSSDDRIEESKSTDLDYEFNCFFLSGQRLDLYRSIDLRCEDMLLGKYVMHVNFVPLFSFRSQKLWYVLPICVGQASQCIWQRPWPTLASVERHIVGWSNEHKWHPC